MFTPRLCLNGVVKITTKVETHTLESSGTTFEVRTLTVVNSQGHEVEIELIGEREGSLDICAVF